MTVAIIAEYNPPHYGHKHQIDEIRKEFGEDTEIIAIMSGSFTERGEMAIADKGTRAAWALSIGVNLILELPFPFSISSAEIFAKSGVKIADELKIVDRLSFGSESGDIEALNEIADNFLSKEYQSKLSDMVKDTKNRGVGYPKLQSDAYFDTFGKRIEDVLTPNNILAIEYIKALKSINSKIIPHTVKRLGAGYNDNTIKADEYQSATAIREALFSNFDAFCHLLPNEYIKEAKTAKNSGLIPIDAEKVSSAILTRLSVNTPGDCSIHDTAGGLYNRLLANAKKADSISSLTSLALTKKFTRARIRRAIWYSYFGITSSEIKALPLYTQILALDTVGQGIVKKIKKATSFPLLTKPSGIKDFSADALRQWQKSVMADGLLCLAMPRPRPQEEALKFVPFIKKD